MKTIKLLLVLIQIFFFNSLYSQTGWFTLQPNTNNWIISVKFLNESTGYIAGWSGVLSKSTNGGANWFSVSPGGSVSYQSLFFTDENTGWVTGGGGAMIKTTNGGQSWISQYSGTNVILNELKFLDANTGWAVGYSGIIIKTTNGGSNWITQYTGTSYNLTSIFFVNNNDGWAAGDNGKVFKTNNGGDNWIPINIGIGNNTGRMWFINASTGWIPGTNGLILKTTNAGSTWTLLNSSTTNYLIMTNFLNAQTGFAIGANGTILKTFNGGDNWIVQNSGSNNNLREIFLLNANTGWIAGDNGTLLKTTNGGVSAPVAPQLISPPNNSLYQSLTPTMTWSNTGGEYYKIQISTNPTFAVITDSATLTVPQYVVPSGKLQTAYTYFWRVNATNSVGTSVWSAVWNFATYTGPPAPSLISPSNGAIDVPITPLFDWSDISTAISYNIQVALDSNFSNIIIDANVTPSQYQVTGALNSGGHYFWRVRALNSNGSSPWTSIWNFTVASVPIAPNLLSPPNNSVGQPLTPTLDWDSIPNATNYKVQISTVSNFATITDSATISLSQYTVPSGKLQMDITYFWRVCASNSLGTGPWSATWRFTVSTVGLNMISSTIPGAFKLYTNYPNPFNPTTKIKFDLPNSAFTQVVVFDALGRKIETLASRDMRAGTFELTWNASKYNSGVYFVRIVSDKSTDTKKMVLLK